MARLTVAILLLALGACGASGSRAEVRGTYDANGKLQLLTYDTNGNGKPDTWAYMDGTKVVRVEIDRNEDGIIERREYYDARQALERVELSTKSDGAVDRWESYADGQVRSVAFDLEGAGRPTMRLVYGSDGSVVRIERGHDLAPLAARR